MAGNWLQMDNDLPEKPETQRICDATGLSVDVVVGRLFLFWRWVDRQATSKNIPHATVTTLMRVAGGDELFWNCVASVGWLVIHDDRIEIPGWSRRFSKSAKSRMLDARRKANRRLRNVRVEPDTNRTTSGAKEEKRRVEKSTEEKNTNTKIPPAARARPPAYELDFEAFWKTYPRHEAKGAAAKAWSLAVKSVALRVRDAQSTGRQNAVALILEAATLFAASPSGQGSFCPHPATWLNQSRFDDDPREWRRDDERASGRKSYQPDPGQKFMPDAG